VLVHDTPANTLLVALAEFGLAMVDHVVPFQRSTDV